MSSESAVGVSLLRALAIAAGAAPSAGLAAPREQWTEAFEASPAADVLAPELQKLMGSRTAHGARSPAPERSGCQAMGAAIDLQPFR